MESGFLSDLATHLLTKYADRLGDCTVVFPNKRAGSFLRKMLSERIGNPAWSPVAVSLEDFLLQFSDIEKADTLTLVFELFEVYKQQQLKAEGFDSFYSWGEMLLQDFEEVDHHLIRPDHIFKYIKDDRQIIETFRLPDDVQKEAISRFWKTFSPATSKTQDQFVKTWKMLLPIYEAFKKQLIEKKIGYPGLAYRLLVAQLEEVSIPVSQPVVFAGFNALRPAEKYLVTHFIENHHAEIFWDVDAYYMEDEKQEAGNYLRKYRKERILGPTFPKKLPEGIAAPREILVTGVSLEAGQAKHIGTEIAKLISSEKARQEEMVIVLPRDHMLFPILSAIPPEVARLNVTMGYPLKETPLYGLLEACIELQGNSRITPETWTVFYHRDVMEILSHPYLHEKAKEAHNQCLADIRKGNRVRVAQQDLIEVNSPFIKPIFRSLKKDESMASYLLSVTETLLQYATKRSGPEQVFLHHFRQLLHRLNEMMGRQQGEIDWKSFRSLFQKISRSLKAPFSGEPVEGLQIMGMMETRNLDFKYVFVPSMNEGTFPSPPQQGSFIPYYIRKAFDLPTFEMQEAIESYLFYRLLQRSKRLHFYYNMQAEFGVSGEISRFIRQLEWESSHTVRYQKLNNPIRVKEPGTITVEKTEDIIRKLKMYTNEGSKKLSPSALDVYLKCRLQFYFRYVLRLFRPDDLKDELYPHDVGNIMHKALELLYKDAIKGKAYKIINTYDFFRLKNSVKGAVKLAFRDHFKLKERQKIELKGRNTILASVIERYVLKVLEKDRSYAPFEIISLEKAADYSRLLNVKADKRTFQVSLKGIIDRIDRKEGIVRVIDYKSGRDVTEIGSIGATMDRHKKDRNKAGFQALYYAWLYASEHGKKEHIVPGIMSIREIFTNSFDTRLKEKGVPVEDVRPYLVEFEQHLTQLLEEIYAMSRPFDQTEDKNTCNWCDFKGICHR